MECIFCKIIEKKVPADILYEDDKVIVFKTIKPSAPIHLLAVPKKHIESIDYLLPEDGELIGDIFLVIKKIAREQGIDKSGYKVAINVGKGGGQEVFHIHFHLLGGWKNAKDRDIIGMP